MKPLPRRGALLLALPIAGCIEIGDIKITIVDDTGLSMEIPEEQEDEPVEVDTAPEEDTAEADSGTPAKDTAEEEEDPVYTAPETFTGPPLGDDVLVFQGHGALAVDSGPYLIDGVDTLVDMYLSLGGDTLITDTWPEDPSPYRLALWYLPGAGEEEGFRLPEEMIVSLLDWLGRGGRLVLAGDVDGEYGGYSLTRGNLTIDDLLRRIDADIRISGTLEETVSCDSPAESDLLASPELISSYLGHAVEIGPGAEWVYCDGIAIQKIWCGEVLVSGDVNLLSDHPELAPELVQNLYTVPVESACE